MIPAMSMNRKQRRQQEKTSGGKVPKKTQERQEKAAVLKAQGLALKSAGQDAEAAARLREALALDPSLADAHFNLAMLARTKPALGIDMETVNATITDRRTLLNSYNAIMVVLRQKRQYREAVICQEEICRLQPDDSLTQMDLGLLLNLTGQYERAALELSRALNRHPEDKIIKGLYSISLQNPQFTKFEPEIRKAITCCFEDMYDVHLRNFWAAWINLLLVDPSYKGFADARLLDDKNFDAWADSLDDISGAFLKDPYFTGGLRRLTIADSLFERVLARLRRYVCLRFDDLAASRRLPVFAPFIYALAEQCFFNEYVYVQSAEEREAAARLRTRHDALALSVSACYEPLYRIMPDAEENLRALAQGDPAFTMLVKTQFDDPREEDRIKPDIPVFGAFANEISRKVQNQYEENPYPRWTTIATATLPNDDLVFDPETRTMPFNILIAGCGTGRHAIGAAIRYPNAKITAIDLSRASLAYGLRKARECGMDKRLKFIHADILAMRDWPEQFDIIECAGVLHHMEDPLAGWEALNSILKPNGLFKIGLYSDIARQPIVRARDFIAKNGYPATADGIRACRQAIFALPTGDPIHTFVSRSIDFFTTSAARDLIFHVQEHRMTLPQIEGMMDRLGLVPVRMMANSPDILFKYDKMFPGDTNRRNFKNWAAFEEKNPLAFAGMYQFWCQKTVR